MRVWQPMNLLHVFVTLVGHVHRFKAYRSQYICQIWWICCVSKFLKWLDLEIWQFLCSRQRYDRLLLPLVHVHRLIMLRTVRLTQQSTVFCMHTVLLVKYILLDWFVPSTTDLVRKPYCTVKFIWFSVIEASRFVTFKVSSRSQTPSPRLGHRMSARCWRPFTTSHAPLVLPCSYWNSNISL